MVSLRQVGPCGCMAAFSTLDMLRKRLMDCCTASPLHFLPGLECNSLGQTIWNDLD